VKVVAPLLLVLLFVLGIHGAPLATVFAKVLSASPIVIALVVGLSLVQGASGALRLWFVFPRGKRPGLVGVARAFSFGQLMNTYLPGRAGDAFKVVWIARGRERRHDERERHCKTKPDGSVSIADSTGALLADRGLDIASLVLLAAVLGGGALVTVLAGMVQSLWMVGVAAALAAVVLGALWRFWPSAFRALRRVLSSTLSAMRGAASAHRLSAMIAIGLAGWIAELVAIMILAAGLGFHLALPHAVVALVVLNLGIALPVSVANVGAFEAAAAVGLAAFGVPMADGIAIGTVLHVGQIAAVVIAALAFWLRDRWIRYAREVPPELLATAAPVGDSPRLLPMTTSARPQYVAPIEPPSFACSGEPRETLEAKALTP
jgi:hypothetical protein